MNKRIIELAYCCIAAICPFSIWGAKPVVMEGVKYTLLKNGVGVTCCASSKDITTLNIPERVKVDGRFYPVVQISEGGFKDCRKLISLVLPQSITDIGEEAFWNCSSLQTAVMPDKAEAKISDGSFGFGIEGIFKGCTSLTKLRGTTMMYPQYLVYDAIYNCTDLPVYASLQHLPASEIDKVTFSNVRFSTFLKERYFPEIEQWQKRKPYETVAQWENRVCVANRDKMVAEAVERARREFLDLFAPVSCHGTLEAYDAEHNLYPVYLGDLGTVYAEVPDADAKAFAEHWDLVAIQPSYGIIDDMVGILNCRFVSGNKDYPSASSYTEDDFLTLSTMLTPLVNLREYELASTHKEENKETRKQYEADSVDIEIPQTGKSRPRTFAVIIGNENYQRVANVEYAQNDARIFAKYCTQTLGIPESNLRTYYDATYGDIVAAVADIKNIAEAFRGDSEIIFYYAGHGIPDESSRSSFILPVDASGTGTESCYPMSKLYEELGSINVKHTLAIMDACFSGSLRGEGMLASARGIKLKPKDLPASGNLIVLSATSGDQTAYPYAAKNHGLFSYFLLNKIKESSGEVTLGEMAEYLRDNVSQRSITVNRKPQHPTVKCSDSLTDSWKDIRF